MMDPPRSVDKNVIKANVIAAGFISNTSLIIFSRIIKTLFLTKEGFYPFT